MISLLLEPFQYAYMVKAIWVCGLISGVCALLSCFVILKGWALMGDALSHAIVPGVALAYLVGIPFAIGAFIAGIMAAVTMGFLNRMTFLREDTIIGIVFTSFLGLGLLLISLFPSGISLQTIIFGNILGISEGDALQVILISLVSLGILGLKLNDLILFAFDPNQAAAGGMNVNVLHYTLLALLSATAVAGLQTVGAILVISTLVTPGATAYLLTDRFHRMLLLAGILGAATGFIGAYLSYFLDGSTGGSIVTLQFSLFILVWILAPKHGLLTRYTQRRLAKKGLAE